MEGVNKIPGTSSSGGSTDALKLAGPLNLWFLSALI